MFYYIIVPGAWLLWHLGFRITVVGRENLIRGRGFILAPNHLSAIDPVFVIIARFWGLRMRIFAKQELFEKNFLLTWFLKQMGCVAVRGTKDERTAIDKTVEECKNGRGLLIFPEGTRSKDGQLGPIKSGAFVVAAAAGVDMIPCRIIYDTPDGKMKLFCRARICFGTPIPASELEMGEKRSAKILRAGKEKLRAAWEELYEKNHF